jgi:acyl-CoA synthetase (AMP-forming)/AMP-acid ligase II
MKFSKGLQHLLEESTGRYPGRIAIEEETNRTITYLELSVLSDQLRDRLHHLGVGHGDRVGIYMHKSIDAVAAIFGILKSGAAYVPGSQCSSLSKRLYIKRLLGKSSHC